MQNFFQFSSLGYKKNIFHKAREGSAGKSEEDNDGEWRLLIFMMIIDSTETKESSLRFMPIGEHKNFHEINQHNFFLFSVLLRHKKIDL